MLRIFWCSFSSFITFLGIYFCVLHIELYTLAQVSELVMYLAAFLFLPWAYLHVWVVVEFMGEWSIVRAPKKKKGMMSITKSLKCCLFVVFREPIYQGSLLLFILRHDFVVCWEDSFLFFPFCIMALLEPSGRNQEIKDFYSHRILHLLV